MSINIRRQNRNTTSETNDSNADSINSIQLRYFDKDINNKRYSNSSNRNNVFKGKEENEEIDILNKIYSTKEREYNNLINQYKEILGNLNKKKEILYQNKSKCQSLIINNNNMRMVLLKLMKIKAI